MLKVCRCEKPQFSMLGPVALTQDGVKRLHMNRPLLGTYFCYSCGGIPAETTDEIRNNADCITGETVVGRLIELGVAVDPEKIER